MLAQGHDLISFSTINRNVPSEDSTHSLSETGAVEKLLDENDSFVGEIITPHSDQHRIVVQGIDTRGEMMSGCIKRVLQRFSAIYHQMTWSEISGSLGDLGTLIPLLVALARKRSVYLAPALFFGGLANVFTGLIWDVPMCVQPMKSIAAVALSEHWSAEIVSAAGVLAGAFTLFIGITNLIELVNILVPIPVVSGLQIGVGIRLVSTGIGYVQKLTWVGTYDCILLAVIVSLLSLYWLRDMSMSKLNHSKESSKADGLESAEENNGRSNSLDEKDVARNNICCFSRLQQIYSCFTNRSVPHPVGIYLFLIGLVFAAITLASSKGSQNSYDLPLRFFGAPVTVMALRSVTREQWKIGLLEGALPQLPLTALNSVIAVCALAHSLYPEKRKAINKSSNDAVISRREVAISVGVMNLCFVPFGSMPNCHGSGGLAGQHRMGARHGASVCFLGVAKILFGIFLGASALTLLDAFPMAILGVLVAVSGQELATTGFWSLLTDLEEKYGYEAYQSAEKKLLLRRCIAITTITAMVIISTGQVHYGVLSGWIAEMVYGNGLSDFSSWVSARKENSCFDYRRK